MSTAPHGTPPGDASVAGPRTGDLPDRLGWAAVLLLTLGLLLTWAPSMANGLGDNHEGRILARHALNVANAERDGLAASGWLSDWSPYVGDGGEQTSYAHHPPLLNLGYYATARLLPVERDTAMRLFAYLVGAAMLPIGAAVLRRLGTGWPATLIATVLVAVTPLFWVYGRLHGNVTLALAAVLVVARLREQRRIGHGELVLAVVVVSASIVAGYLGMAIAALLGLWLLARRGIDTVTVTLGLAMVVAAAVSVGYVLTGTGAARVGEQVQLRTGGGEFSAAEFLERIRTWLTSLLPGWWRWLVVPAAVVAGLATRRTRGLTLLLWLVAVAYVVGLPNGAFIHDYWVFPVLLPLWIGAAAAVEACSRWLRERMGPGGSLGRPSPAPPGPPGRTGAWTGVTLALVLALGAVSGLRSEIPSRYITGPEQAGTLVREIGPSPAQTTAWRGPGIPAPRWLSYYWQLPPGEIDPAALEELDGQDRVLVRLERLEDSTTGTPEVVGRSGGYAVVTVDQLRDAAPG